jgi:glycosyltransferase involved in cell wall biosynthesis
VIVVDDVTTRDATRDIARAFGATLIVSEAGMAESRNVGIREAAGTTILSIDSDMALEPGLLRHIETLRSAGFDGATIAERSSGEGYWARSRYIDKLAIERVGLARSLRVFARSMWEGVGGYDPQLEAGEDLDFDLRCRRTGARIVHVASPGIIHLEGRVSIWRSAKKKFGYGASLPQFEAKHGSLALADGFARRLMAGCGIAVSRDKAALPGFIALKLAEAGAGLAGRAVATARRRER